MLALQISAAMSGACSRVILSSKEKGKKRERNAYFLVSRYIKYILRVTVMTPVNYVKSPTVAKACSKALKSCQYLGGNEGTSDHGKALNQGLRLSEHMRDS